MWEIKNLSNEQTLIISFLKLFQRNQTPQRNVVPQNNDDEEESPLVINEEPEMKRGRHENLPSLPQLPVSSQFPAMPSNMAGFNQYMLLQVIYTFHSLFFTKNSDFIQTDIKISISGDTEFEFHARVQK